MLQGPGRHCPPLYRLLSRNEGQECVSMTWRAIFAQHYLHGHSWARHGRTLPTGHQLPRFLLLFSPPSTPHMDRCNPPARPCPHCRPDRPLHHRRHRPRLRPRPYRLRPCRRSRSSYLCRRGWQPTPRCARTATPPHSTGTRRRRNTGGRRGRRRDAERPSWTQSAAVHSPCPRLRRRAPTPWAAQTFGSTCWMTPSLERCSVRMWSWRR
jgi:hypothetical protein